MVLDNIIWPGEEEKEDDNGCSVAIRCKMAGYLRQFVETGILFSYFPSCMRLGSTGFIMEHFESNNIYNNSEDLK